LRKSFLAAWLACLCAVPACDAHAADAAIGGTVESLLEYARDNPEYAAMLSESTAASQRIYPAGALPDPVFRTELQNVTNAGSERGPSLLPAQVGATKYTLMQTFPFWGKRDLRREIAEADAVQAQGRAAGTWAEIAGSIKVAFAKYYLAVRSEELTREIAELMQRLERVASARYENGLAPQQDVIRAQLELTAMRSELLALEGEREGLRATINALLARDVSAPLAAPVRLRAMPPPARLDPTALAARLRGRNPQVFVEEARIRSAEKSRELAYLNRYPDVTAGVSPMQMGSRIAEWELMFEVSIPLQQESRRRQESEAESMLAAARLRKQAVGNRLVGELQENVAALQSALRMEILTSTSLLPQSEATLQSALAGYENGKVDFATLLDAQRQIRKARVDRLKAQAEVQVRLAAIERLLGEDL
jgi:outer membrane protein, heavy metal efflux system